MLQLEYFYYLLLIDTYDIPIDLLEVQKIFHDGTA